VLDWLRITSTPMIVVMLQECFFTMAMSARDQGTRLVRHHQCGQCHVAATFTCRPNLDSKNCSRGPNVKTTKILYIKSILVWLDTHFCGGGNVVRGAGGLRAPVCLCTFKLGQPLVSPACSPTKTRTLASNVVCPHNTTVYISII
jgi:hypothetical protein